ncbi:hypothetical protein HPP92_018896 [Vanilla planifolia]|uniref:Uncharacterized protein n=1 Tax=Vanilla planifolia TaxID=51239 RepID=A0A835Q8H8_VANPL|nr:hypothetical protein HPP92_018896 [Vanilla planifolia]
MENSISGETASESYLTEGFTSQADMVVDMTLNCATCCTDLVRENAVPVANEFGIKDTSDNEFSVKTVCTSDHDKVGCHATEEHASNRQLLLPNGYPVVGFNRESLPSAISTEVDLKAISANFRGESFCLHHLLSVS